MNMSIVTMMNDSFIQIEAERDGKVVELQMNKKTVNAIQQEASPLLETLPKNTVLYTELLFWGAKIIENEDMTTGKILLRSDKDQEKVLDVIDALDVEYKTRSRFQVLEL